MHTKPFLKLLGTGLTALAMGLSLTGCATIIHGDNEKFTLNSQPTHANIAVDGQNYGKTPAVVNLTRKKEHSITISLAGFNPQTVRLQPSFSGWTIGNVVFGGVIGIAVDAVDGAMYKLSPEQVSAYAAENNFQYDKKHHVLTVILVKNANPHWKKIGQLKKA